MQAPRPHRMMPVTKPQILQRIAADNASRAYRAQIQIAPASRGYRDQTADPANIKAATELYAPAPVHQVMHPKPETFYVNVYQLSPGRNFFGSPSAGPLYSNHAVYRLRVTLKVPA